MLLPVLSKEKSDLKIVTISGEIFYAHNVQKEYRYDQRLKVIQGFSRYFKSLSNPPPIQDAYSVLLWHLFSDFLNAYSFKWATTKKKPNEKHLYILRNSAGFIKVGISSNVKARIVDLSYEWGGKWEIIKIYHNMGSMERYLHQKLADYTYPIRHRETNKWGRECFVDCPEVLEICKNLS